MTLYEIKAQKLDTLVDNLNSDITNILKEKRLTLGHLTSNYILENPYMLLTSRQEELSNKEKLLKKEIKGIIDKNDASLQYILQTLKLVNPLNILDKGYSLIKKNGIIIKESKNLKIKDNLHVILHDGEINVEVKEIIS